MKKHAAPQHCSIDEVNTGAFTISFRTRIAADAQILWRMAANPHRHHELDGSSTLSTKVTGPEVLDAGDTFNIWMSKFGIPYTFTMATIESIPAQQVAWQHPAGHIWRWSFAPVDDNADETWVTETFDYTRVKPLLIRLWRTAGIFETNAAHMRTALAGLQERFATG